MALKDVATRNLSLTGCSQHLHYWSRFYFYIYLSCFVLVILLKAKLESEEGMKWFKKVWEEFIDLFSCYYYCEKHPKNKVDCTIGCSICWAEISERLDKEERERKIRIIADGVKLAHMEMQKETSANDSKRDKEKE